MQSFFARRTSWNLATNRYTRALEAHRRAGKELLDLTASNPTTVGLQYREDTLLRALANPEALRYEPQPKGLLCAREAIAAYYAERGSSVSPNDLVLTTSTSEAYSFVFRLLCNHGDALLVPSPSYPLFDFLADIQDVRLFVYELIYDHGWQIDIASFDAALKRAGPQCRAALVVHPNNPTGSFVKPHETEQLYQRCADAGLAIIADEVFLDYSLAEQAPLTFSTNREALTFTLSGLSKISALPQMKVAWIAASGPQPLKSDALSLLEIIADTYLSMNTPVQLALPTMLDERHSLQQQLLERVRTNLAQLDAQLASQQLCRRLEVEGGWYAILRVPATAVDEELAIALLDQTGVLVQPGHFYELANGHLVISLITETEVFREGVTRILRRIAASST